MKRKRYIRISLVILFLYLFWQVWSSYHCLKITSYTISSDTIESPIRIAVIADLHDGSFGVENKRLIQQISQQDPDVVFMVGDMLNGYSENAEAVCLLVQNLSQEVPVYYALGNHELEYMDSHPEFVEKIQQAGAVVVDKCYADVTVCGQRLRIGGLYDYAFALNDQHSIDPEGMDEETYSFLTEFEDTDAYKMMLAHRPDSFIFAQQPDAWEIDLVLSGHVHGGQVVLPLVGGLWAPDQGWFPDYVQGMHEWGQMKMVITTGLGSQKESLPRFHNVPEIVMIDLE